MADLSVYLAHIVSQTRQNIHFLISQHKISPTDGSEILAKLPALNDSSILGLSIDTHPLTVSPPHINPNPQALSTSTATPTAPVPEPNGSSQAPAAPPPAVRARALWDYKNPESTSDLAFRAGDMIEVLAEPHGDWWSGRNLRCGLFPSIYVQKVTAAAAGALSPASSLSQLPWASTPTSISSSSSLSLSTKSSPPMPRRALGHSPRKSDASATSSPLHAAPNRSASGPALMSPLSHADRLRSLPKTPLPLSAAGR